MNPYAPKFRQIGGSLIFTVCEVNEKTWKKLAKEPVYYGLPQYWFNGEDEWHFYPAIDTSRFEIVPKDA